MTNSKIINCYICGTWTKFNKYNYLYICPKCKAKFKVIENNGKEEIVRYYEDYAEYVERRRLIVGENNGT